MLYLNPMYTSERPLRNGIPRPPIKSFVRARRLTTPPPPTLSIGSGRDSSVVGSPFLPLPFLSLLFCPSAVVVVVVIHNRDGVGVCRRRRTSSLSLSHSDRADEGTNEAFSVGGIPAASSGSTTLCSSSFFWCL